MTDRPIDTLYTAAARLAALRPLFLGGTEITDEIIEGIHRGLFDAEEEIRDAIAALEGNDDTGPESGDPNDGEPHPDAIEASSLHLVSRRAA